MQCRPQGKPSTEDLPPAAQLHRSHLQRCRRLPTCAAGQAVHGGPAGEAGRQLDLGAPRLHLRCALVAGGGGGDEEGRGSSRGVSCACWRQGLLLIDINLAPALCPPHPRFSTGPLNYNPVRGPWCQFPRLSTGCWRRVGGLGGCGEQCLFASQDSAVLTWRPPLHLTRLPAPQVEEWFFHRLKAGRPIPVPGSGMQARSGGCWVGCRAGTQSWAACRPLTCVAGRNSLHSGALQASALLPPTHRLLPVAAPVLLVTAGDAAGPRQGPGHRLCQDPGQPQGRAPGVQRGWRAVSGGRLAAGSWARGPGRVALAAGLRLRGAGAAVRVMRAAARHGTRTLPARLRAPRPALAQSLPASPGLTRPCLTSPTFDPPTSHQLCDF